MDLRKIAEELASRPYAVLVAQNETTDGKPIFIAMAPELGECISQGWSEEEAVQNLEAARVDFICSLLDDNLPVPPPQAQLTNTTSGTSISLQYTLIPSQSPAKKNASHSLPVPDDVIRITVPDFVT